VERRRRRVEPSLDTCSKQSLDIARYPSMRRLLRSKWIRLPVWIVAVLIAISAVASTLDVRYDDALRANPVATEATVTDVYINGFGGDPAVDYRYKVGQQTFTGSGNAQLDQGGALALKDGDNIHIRYAAAKPSVSCTCDPAGESGLWGLAFVLPLAVLIFATIWDRRHPQGRRVGTNATSSP
jgi:hypothetical protein